MSDLQRADERELVERAKRNPREFGVLYDRHFQQIYRFVYSRVREQTAAEDVTSEIFMKALRAMPRYQDTGRPFAAWLYQIAVNAIADRFRTLPAQQRTALVLKFQEDMKIEDIAVAMGKTSGAVKLLIHRGVSRLREEAGVLRPAE